MEARLDKFSVIYDLYFDAKMRMRYDMCFSHSGVSARKSKFQVQAVASAKVDAVKCVLKINALKL